MRLSIQSKLIIAVVLISLSAALFTGILGYRSGEAALRKSIYDRLTGIRVSKATQVERFINGLHNQVQSFSEDLMIVEATRDFRAAVDKLKGKKISAEENTRLLEFYEKQFLPELVKHVDAQPVLKSVLPDNDLQAYLQYHYIVNNPNKLLEKDRMPAAQDDSEYSRVHLKYHEVINNFRKLFGLDDVMILDAETSQVIYSAGKQIDLGTDFDTGALSRTAVAEDIRLLQRERDKDSVRIVDFEPYRPSLGLPTAFAISPIFDGNSMIGILAVQFPIMKLNDIMSGNNNWAKQGVGQTGEIVLAAEDGYMRNESRYFTEDRKNYFKMLNRAGTAREEVAKTERLETTILTVRLKSEAFKRVLAGQEGTDLITDYLGQEVLASYGPLDIQGLRWGIIAKIPTAESFEPIRKFTHDLLTTLVAIGLISSLLATLMGHLLSKPVRKLIRASNQLATGKLNTRVDINSNDEFEDLGQTFNSMAAELEVRKNKLDEKIAENERLLESMLPPAVAARLRSAPGEQQSDTHADVTIIYAEVKGFDSFSESLEPARALNLLNRLIVSFDEAAERQGVEKLKSIGASYLAVCGLSIQRFDHSQRAVAFALSAEQIVAGFNRDNGSQLVVNIGIHRGPVTGGIIGRSKFIYDLWGRTVDYARGLVQSDSTGVIQISREVYDRVAGLYACSRTGEATDNKPEVYLISGQPGTSGMAETRTTSGRTG